MLFSLFSLLFVYFLFVYLLLLLLAYLGGLYVSVYGRYEGLYARGNGLGLPRGCHAVLVKGF